MKVKVKVKRTNTNTLCRVVWFVTCNCCDRASYLYHTGKVIKGETKGCKITFCHDCMKKYDLKFKGAVGYVNI